MWMSLAVRCQAAWKLRDGVKALFLVGIGALAFCAAGGAGAIRFGVFVGTDEPLVLNPQAVDDAPVGIAPELLRRAEERVGVATFPRVARDTLTYQRKLKARRIAAIAPLASPTDRMPDRCRAASADVVSLHPLPRPKTRSRALSLAFCPGNPPVERTWVEPECVHASGDYPPAEGRNTVS